MSAPSSGWAGVWEHRRVERRLLLLVAFVVATGWLSLVVVRLAQAPVIPERELWPLAIFLAALPLTHLLLVFFGVKGDPVLPPAAMLLTGIGLLAQHRMGAFEPHAAGMATLAFPLGWAAMLLAAVAFAGGRHRILAALSLPALLGACALLAAILVAGRSFRGALFLPGHMNPAEFVKPLLVIFLAGFLARHREDLATAVGGLPAPAPRAIGTLLLLWSVPMAMLLLQHDLGMLILLNLTLIVMLFLATRRPGWLAVGLVAGAALGALIFRFTPHGRARLGVWLDPFGEETGPGWQVLQGLSAMYSGGLWGSGVGAGFPQMIPIASSDFIYAALGEEIGFAGCGVLLLLYLLLFARGLRAAYAQREPFAHLLAAGTVVVLAAQTLWNIGGVTKALPLTGIPLPFVSQGGSSLVTCLALVGLLVAVSDETDGGRPAAPARKKKKKTR